MLTYIRVKVHTAMVGLYCQFIPSNSVSSKAKTEP